MTRLLTFFKSLFWHISLGLPKCNQQQINDRFSICIVCDKYDYNKSQCLVCGCNINNRKIFLNKLAWKDQECPLKKWAAIK